VDGGYATHVVAAVGDVFAKPEALSFAQASGLLLTGVTAVHLLTAAGVDAGDTVLVHGASGGVGLMVTQLAVARGARVIGTAGAARLDAVRAFGGEPVTYGEGLAQRVRELAPSGIDVALDTVGTDEAVDTSIELVTDRSRIASIAAFGRAPGLGIALLGGGPGADPGTAVRAAARQPLVDLARAGRLIVTLDRTFPLDEAGEAHAYLAAGHAQGKLALIP
jgi:NADPH:quinone reductase-like Zn-dependent oxidoreductase